MTVPTETSVSETADPFSSWSMQAAKDRDLAIDTLQLARQRVRAVRQLLDTYDTSLSAKLTSCQAALNERLGYLLVAREDAQP